MPHLNIALIQNKKHKKLGRKNTLIKTLNFTLQVNSDDNNHEKVAPINLFLKKEGHKANAKLQSPQL